MPSCTLSSPKYSLATLVTLSASFLLLQVNGYILRLRSVLKPLASEAPSNYFIFEINPSKMTHKHTWISLCLLWLYLIIFISSIILSIIIIHYYFLILLIWQNCSISSHWFTCRSSDIWDCLIRHLIWWLIWSLRLRRRSLAFILLFCRAFRSFLTLKIKLLVTVIFLI